MPSIDLIFWRIFRLLCKRYLYKYPLTIGAVKYLVGLSLFYYMMANILLSILVKMFLVHVVKYHTLNTKYVE